MLLHIGGIGTRKGVYASEIADLERSGYSVLFLNPERGIKPKPDDAAFFTQLSLPETIQAKIAEVLEILAQEGIERADFIGVSAGAPVAAAVVACYPEFASTLLIANPAGLCGKDQRANFVGHALWQSVVQEPGYALGKALCLDFYPFVSLFRAWRVGKLFKNAWWRYSEEVPALLRTNIMPVLYEVKKSGVSVILLNAHNDRIFPSDRVESSLGDDPFTFIDRWAMYAAKKASHNAAILEHSGVFAQMLAQE